MQHDDVFHRAFRHACDSGDTSDVKEAIMTGRLTVEDLDEGLKFATRMRHVDIVTALFEAGARVTLETTRSLPGADGQQDPRIVHLFLECGMDPNATHSELIMKPKRSTSSTPTPLRPSDGEPDLPYVHLSGSSNDWLTRLRVWTDSKIACSAILKASVCCWKLVKTPIAAGLEEFPRWPRDHKCPGARYLPTRALYRIRRKVSAVRPRVPQSEVMTRFLLDRGLNPNVASDDEWGTPLHCAAANGKVNLVKMLLEAGADPTVIPSSSTKFGRVTPARAAKNRVRHQESLEEILHLLESYSCQESRQPS